MADLRQVERLRVLTLTSPDIKDGEPVPEMYTGDGDDVSPPLEWSAPPGGTESFAVIMDDPDAPGGTFTHWVVFNLPPWVKNLEAGRPNTPALDNGATQAKNDFGRFGYGGPAPPSGTHRYVFRVYAVNRMLTLGPGASKAEVLAAMAEHVLAEGELIGIYSAKA